MHHKELLQLILIKMKIIYKYIATDKKYNIPLTSPYVVSYALYPSSFVASLSNIADWDIVYGE